MLKYNGSWIIVEVKGENKLDDPVVLANRWLWIMIWFIL